MWDHANLPLVVRVPPALRGTAAALIAGYVERVLVGVVRLPIAIVTAERKRRVDNVGDTAMVGDPTSQKVLHATDGTIDVVGIAEAALAAGVTGHLTGANSARCPHSVHHICESNTDACNQPTHTHCPG
jgi:hypothetical protein